MLFFLLFVQIENDPLQLFRELEGHLAAKNLEQLGSLFHSEAIWTSHSGQVQYGPEEIKTYFHNFFEGPNATVKSLQVRFELDGEPVPLSDSLIQMSGPVRFQFELLNNTDFDISARWSAVLEKMDNKWMIRSLHDSGNLFENDIIDRYKSMLPKIGFGVAGVGLAVGLLLGFLIGKGQKIKPAQEKS